MRKNIQKVFKAFAGGESAVGDAKHTCSTDGVTIYSYDMLIARRFSDGEHVMTEVIREMHSPSRTTSSQIKAVQFLLIQHNQQFMVVDQITDTKPHVFKKVYR